jgi:hypothetical protein
MEKEEESGLAGKTRERGRQRSIRRRRPSKERSRSKQAHP